MECIQSATNLENEYKPTKAEEALLEVLLNPENRMKTVADICKIAKIDRATYYRAFAKPEFAKLYRQRSTDIVRQAVAPVLNTFVREAIRGSFQHGKVILEMADVYTESSKIEHAIKVKLEDVL